MRNTEQNPEIYVHIPSNDIPNLAELDKQMQFTKHKRENKRRRIKIIFEILGLIIGIISLIMSMC